MSLLTSLKICLCAYTLCFKITNVPLHFLIIYYYFYQCQSVYYIWWVQWSPASYASYNCEWQQCLALLDYDYEWSKTKQKSTVYIIFLHGTFGRTQESYMHAYYEHQYMYFLVPPSPEEYVDWNSGRAQVPDCSQNPFCLHPCMM